jgi:hypothetical protein
MRLIRALAVAVVCVSAMLAAPARAGNELIEFEFTGVFTAIGPGVQHTVGEQFTSTVLFDPTTPDLNGSSNFGEYRYLRWVTPSPTAIPNVFEPPPGSASRITVFSRSDGTNQWQIEFLAPLFIYTLAIDFPPSTFATDALPLTLNLSLATDTRFNATSQVPFPPSNIMTGDIASLTVREVPEPVSTSLLALICALLKVRRSPLRDT